MHIYKCVRGEMYKKCKKSKYFDAEIKEVNEKIIFLLSH
jgi:hypothetical protein